MIECSSRLVVYRSSVDTTVRMAFVSYGALQCWCVINSEQYSVVIAVASAPAVEIHGKENTTVQTSRRCITQLGQVGIDLEICGTHS